jgi:hypothetical protein
MAHRISQAAQLYMYNFSLLQTGATAFFYHVSFLHISDIEKI